MPSRRRARSRRLNPDAQRVCDALQRRGEASGKTLTDDTRLPNKSVHNLLRTLEAWGVVERVGRGRWRVA